MKIAILGSGSLGSAIGGLLARGGNDVSLISRTDAYISAVNTDGLIVIEEGHCKTVRLHATMEQSPKFPVDLMIVLVKSMNTREAAFAARSYVGENTTVLSLQNGLGHETILASIFGADKVIAGKTYVGGVLQAPNKVTVSASGKETVIGELSGETSERIIQISETFNKAGLLCQVSNNIRGVMWDKLLVNIATGAISAITRLNYGNLYDIPLLKETAIEAVAEAMDVAATLDISLTTQHPEDAWTKAASGLGFNFKASMLQSLEKGATTEIDFINGAVVRYGTDLNVPTPVNATLVACVKGIERALSPKIEVAA